MPFWLARTIVTYANCKAEQGGEFLAHAKIQKKGGEKMKNSKETSAKAASAASTVLRSDKTSKASKTAAGSALAQRPSKKTK